MHFLSNLSQLLTRRHFLMLDDTEIMTQSQTKGSKKRYSSDTLFPPMSMHAYDDLMNDDHIIQNPEVNFEDPVDPLTFSITQGLQALKAQLNLDLTDLQPQLDDPDSLFPLDLNHPDISHLLMTPPTMGTQLQHFRHKHDLRNQLTVNGGALSSQSSSSDGKLYLTSKPLQ